MPLRDNNFPSSFGLLRQEIRIKAIQIAKQLIEKGFNDDTAYAIAFTNARLCTDINLPNDFCKENVVLHLVPHPECWVLITTNGQTEFIRERTKSEALIKARSFAKSRKGKLIIHSEHGLIQDQENFNVNRPVSGPIQELVRTEDKWELRQQGEERPSFIFESKNEAIRKAKTWAKDKNSKLLIHNDNGEIEETHSFEL